ncbi:S9 family peptidase [Pacificimonas flava]|uniref:S9 family peptidase n=2 Tax=Pacificimonas TaxID=1960290 RepID=A0A219B5M9_9SPHN|nr:MULTISPECIES: prolyl oligopeptidase family serine peptidase [Pacificimonas]MBZ6377200.1 S9 family peptidase [Pacificimonas aurantium]OWV33078.1 S9 family peptidase [Pacificimonas flava]
MKLISAAFLTLLAGCAATTSDTGPTVSGDPYLWLEEVESDAALAQVREWNGETAAALTEDASFETYRERAYEILANPDRLSVPNRVLGDRVTNFWTDSEHTHGIWRVATIDDMLAGTPMWRTVLDLDALSVEENRNWVWKGANCLAPAYQRCLVSLSDGGSDAGYVREFDLSAGRFIEGGFTLPEAKHDVTWMNRDTLLISSDFGPDSLTESGYGRQVRIWQRGVSLSDAPVLLEIPASEVGFSVFTASDDGTLYPIISRNKTFWLHSFYHVLEDGTLREVPMPDTASITEVFDGKAIVRLHEGWGDYPAGSLVAYDLDAFVRDGSFGIEPVFTPSETQAIEQVAAGADRLYISLLDDVSGRLIALDRNWKAEDVPVPENGVVHVAAAGGKRDIAFFTAESFANPPQLFATQSGEEPALIEARSPAFDPDSIDVEQRFATSSDGTKIPYFVVRPAGAEGPLPTIMHAYGGFRIAQLPDYLIKHPYRIGPMGLFWVQEGGSFVLANIRGGGEYGPDWHESVLKENRQKVFDDLYAVGEDLKQAGLSSTLAASGRSNGGLLVGVAMTQRPDLFDGIIMGVPLADMQRYDKLLAGASWTGEYGDPDVPAEWETLRTYSPYQNLTPGADYPAPMIYTSTKDDRVHPAHARKMAARLEEFGKPFYYYENIEGGHAGAANQREEAYRAALMMAYARRVLK